MALVAGGKSLSWPTPYRDHGPDTDLQPLRISLAMPVPADPTVLHPMPEQPRVVLLRPLVKSPLIEVGEYSYYDDPDHSTAFETRNVLYHYGPERLVIGKFCALGTGVRFIMNGANHRMDGPSTFPFPTMGGSWSEHFDLLTGLPNRGDTLVGPASSAPDTTNRTSPGCWPWPGGTGLPSTSPSTCGRSCRAASPTSKPRPRTPPTCDAGTHRSCVSGPRLRSYCGRMAGLAARLLSTSKDLTPATVGKAITTLAVSRPSARSASGQPNLLAFNRLIAFEGVAGG